MKPITLTEIRYSLLISHKAEAWALENIDYLNKPMKLFGSSMKVEKGSYKADTYILYLQPANKVSRKTLCAGAKAAGCEGPCLISSGMLGMTTGQRAATKRTILFLLRPMWFKSQLLSEVDKAERKSLRTGIAPLFRLNGTSDIDFSDIISERPYSRFYDYTKELSRVRKNDLPNYHLTYSGSMFSTASKRALGKAVERGYNIAVAFNTKGLESDNIQIPVFQLDNFDTTDLRPYDTKGAIGALSRKGSNKAERAREGAKSFFITAANYQEFNNIIARSA